ncbi:hypothetical protein DER44DRAFT_744525 [Fusarium oxysporum]|nr:hypothetical protein DER44DRAFT_744525 [Fusarium oxysporum]
MSQNIERVKLKGAPACVVVTVKSQSGMWMWMWMRLASSRLLSPNILGLAAVERCWRMAEEFRPEMYLMGMYCRYCRQSRKTELLGRGRGCKGRGRGKWSHGGFEGKGDAQQRRAGEKLSRREPAGGLRLQQYEAKEKSKKDSKVESRKERKENGRAKKIRLDLDWQSQLNAIYWSSVEYGRRKMSRGEGPPLGLAFRGREESRCACLDVDMDGVVQGLRLSADKQEMAAQTKTLLCISHFLLRVSCKGLVVDPQNALPRMIIAIHDGRWTW